jgi:peptidoglycan hydrolase CwlO-like protein
MAKTSMEIKDYVGKILSHSESVAKVVPDVQRINTNLGEILDIEGTMPTQMDELSDKVTKLTEKLHSEVIEIEDAMGKTNSLLEMKFDEFTELLKKSNTEALVEVMKKVTEEFQKQMGELINKLVQENFDQLNKSVEQLNTWQKENKEMIVSLTKQYKQMADNFDATSTTLTKVGGDTKLLVSDGGKLKQIIDALNKVLIEDTKFIEVSTKLADTATLTKDNMQKFDDSTKSLNEWVKKQRNFVDGVNLLINKLDEINKINDYSEEFWKNTRKGLNDAIGSIRGSIDALNNEIGELDEHFYQRLNATLSELDTCMQAMIQGRR